MDEKMINEKIEKMQKSLQDWAKQLENAKEQISLHTGYLKALTDLLEEIKEPVNDNAEEKNE